MIDPATSAKIPGMDASLAGSAASHRSDAKAGNGFHDALSNAGHSSRSRQDRENTTTGQAPEGDAAAGADAEASDAKATKPGRPLIDVSQSALSRASAASSARGATVDEAATESAADDMPADGTVPGRKTAKPVAGHPAAGGNGASDETLDAGQVAAVVKHVQTAKGDKTERTDKPAGEGETAVDGEAEVAPDGKASDLGDVLTMLSNTTTAAPQAGQATPRADGKTTSRAAAGELAVVEASSGDMRTSRTAESGELPSVETAETETADADRSFRFLRADGKGQAVSMRVGQSDGETAKYDIGSPKDGGQTVAVLDARRYIAPASTNAAGLTAAMMGDGEWASAMLPGSELANAASQSSSGKVVNTLKLQMSPIELGNVTATLRLSGEELSVQITVETHAAYKQLSGDQDDMLKALRAHGFAVDQIQISVNVAAADRADSGQSGAQGQSTGQQAQGGAQGGNGSGERRGAALQAENGTGTGKTADDTSALQTASGGAGGSRPGHVYM
ncbi:flagellar hook-length control protein FliK [Rhizobium sp. KAs_5_22]|uniref:flagellar hook-length control protein FliK n=1 Tax=Ciceribacter selenitireducens TaxID=448181 RepID=UPI0004AE1592|nr:flagellar hook-length control protein FliK [Ciceribacter selenitireducens]PPJ47795.1 flagellar hook-length control protein FliK [Rhizobium sp. KAs_5_22]